MEGDRFSLLLLEPGEIYFEDFSAIFIPVDTIPSTYDIKKQPGRLKLCSKSLVFDPKDINKPLIKIPLKDCDILEQWKGSAKFLQSSNVLSVRSRQYIEMLEKNIVAPYKFMEGGNFLFILNYAQIADCLPRISQLQRASTLPAAEHADMIATIVHSRQARVRFDQMWLDLYETTVMETQADKVSPLVVNPGRILLSNINLYFQPYNNIETYPVLKINLNSIKRLVKRRFLLRQIGLEIYSNENDVVPHLYLSFRTQADRDNLYTTLLQQPELKLEDIRQDIMTLQWQNGVISNYEYLVYINSQADRTVNDLTQYPVFPWVISDYQSSELNLNNPNVFRDLLKPIGALNEARLQRLMERYEEMSHPKFLYGSHYSTPGFVLFYLVRLYPHYMLCLQNGRFDHPDRMFNSVADVYRNCLNNLSDFKELVPEFYDLEKEGKFLVNEMGIHFGYRHNGIKVGDVELPPWADNPKHFVQKLRDALESDYVSKTLHHWIDLIFGYKQRGEEAAAAKNLFYHLCYEGSVDLEAISDLNQRHALEVQIMEFGQIPKQIFKVPHPERRNFPQILKHPSSIGINNESEYVEIWNSLKSLELKSSFKTHRDSVRCVVFGEDDDKVISVGSDAKMKIFSISLNRQIRSANIGTMPLSSCSKLPNMNVLIIGSFANNIILYDLDFGKITQDVLAHEDAITCLEWGKQAELLATGSGDCTIRLWKGISTGNSIKPVQCLMTQLDHTSQVTCLAFDPANKFLTSGTEDGDLYIWNIDTLSLMKKTAFHSGSIRAICCSSDGQKIASCGDDGLFQIMDVNTGMALFHKTFSEPLRCLQWSDLLLVLGSSNGTVHVWNTNDVICLGQIKAHEGAVNSVDISPDRKLIVTGGEDHHVNIWQPL